MNIGQANFSGDPNIGLYAVATDSICLIPNIKKWVEDILVENLQVKTLRTTIANTNVLGIFCAGNSNGLILPEFVSKKELSPIKKQSEVMIIKGSYNAIGNLILANDNGCIISDKIKKYKDEISDFLKVKVAVKNFGELDIVGSLAVANKKGCALSKFVDKKDLEIIETALRVKADYSTINFGSSFLRSGMLANSNGVVIGDQTTGPEMQNIIECLRFF